MTENGPWTPRDHQQDPLDPRCDAVDAAIDAALDATAPRDVPIGLVDRVSQASLQQLAHHVANTGQSLSRKL